MSGQVALVTGGSRGIGRAIALRLAEMGADVAINFWRNRKAAEETVEAIRAYGHKGEVYKANVGLKEQLHGLFERLAVDFDGRLDILVSNAASGVLKPALELTYRHWQWTMDINAATLMHLAKHAVPLMGDRGGKIIAISSLGSVRAIPGYAAVGASKAALESFVRHLAIELAPRGINVNTISAGVVETDALKHFPNREQLLDGSLRKTPAGRLAVPGEIADAVLFLVSPYAKMIHGHTLVVDGGYSIVA
ncbi:MAG TPA: enoyl-[acyl-carrier-protein] reductase FabL [Bacteroidetes bacterium]|nr:enoyl-[acyl-carrier-protein] reductase FabL [Bacteroidota bacterium]